MKFCPKCGRERKPGASGCPSCGFDFTTTGSGAVRKSVVKDSTLEDGKTLSGRYRIIALLGKGGMGRVYKAYDLQLDEVVALKMLESEAADEEIVNRFIREIKIARTVTHENVCRIYDLVEAEGKKFISMQFIDGLDLKTILVKQGRMDLSRAVPILLNILNALDAIHKKEIVHRDLKPANIMVSNDGTAYITDFGIAKGGSSQDLTRGKGMIGTPTYMSPEQIQGKDLDRSSDIYSFGVMMYHIFTGKAPFEADSSYTLAMMHINDEPVPPAKLAPALPVKLEELILKCMAKVKSLRPSTDEIRRTLLELSKREKLTQKKPESDYERTVPAEPVTEVSSKLKVVLIVGCFILAAAIIAYFIGGEDKTGKSSQNGARSRDASVAAVESSKLVLVEGGTAKVGTNEFPEDNNSPERQVEFKSFNISKYEVTNKEYLKFVKDSGHLPPPPEFWPAGHYRTAEEEFPVVGVSRDDAQEYCRFYGMRLPMEEEWEYAARTDDGLSYPWGKNYVAGNANVSTGVPASAGRYDGDRNPLGIFDLAGNISEWTNSETEKPDAQGNKVRYYIIRGGSWDKLAPIETARFTYRGLVRMGDVRTGYSTIGFRCVKNAD